ncbi:MAG: hypothetical protein AAFX45_13175 [Pseudomonadota bacterium]
MSSIPCSLHSKDFGPVGAAIGAKRFVTLNFSKARFVDPPAKWVSRNKRGEVRDFSWSKKYEKFEQDFSVNHLIKNNKI